MMKEHLYRDEHGALRVEDEWVEPIDGKLTTLDRAGARSPRPLQHTPWVCIICGLHSSAAPWWSKGYRMCGRCKTEQDADSRAAFSAWWNSALESDDADYYERSMEEQP